MSFYDELMQDFRKMLNFRNYVGYATAIYISSVTPFIEYCGTHYSEADCLTKEMVDDWLRCYPYKTDNTRSAFVSLLRQYAKFINALGKKGFIPDEDYTIPRQPYVPYVFTDGELLALFDAIDSIPCCRVKKFRRDLVLPAMFRMMYCCGMRPSEPLHLRSKDVDLVTGDVYIRQSKRHQGYGNLDGINDISRIRDTRTKKLVWLSIEDMQMLLQQPDTSRKTGIRDRFFLALLYNSGCRIEEIISLRVKDFVINRNGEAELHVIGKGAKYRCTLITSDVIEI